MAQQKIQTGGMKFEVNFEGLEKKTDDFRQARRELDRSLAAGLKRAAEKEVLPAAKMNARRHNLKVDGKSVADSLKIMSTGRRARLTTGLNAKKRKAVGLLEWGGKVETPIVAKEGKAINTPWGPRSVVYRGGEGRGQVAVHKPIHFLTDAKKKNMQAVRRETVSEILQAFERAGLEVRQISKGPR